MYPIDENSLRVGELVEHWSRTVSKRDSKEALLEQILAAFWLGDIDLRPPDASPPLDRIDILAALRDGADPDQFLFYEHESEVPPPVVALPDGSAEVDLRPCIRLLRDRAAWTSSNLHTVFQEIAKLPIAAYPNGILTAFRIMIIHRNDFSVLCDARRWERPQFWFATSRRSKAHQTIARAITECRKWLRDQSRGRKRQSKDQYWTEAEQRFLRLSRHAFDKIWKEEAPDNWRKPGAPGKRPSGRDYSH